MTQQDWKNKNILGLDISQERTGWALLHYTKIEKWGKIDRPPSFEGVKFKDAQFPFLLNAYFEKLSFQLCNLKEMVGHIDSVVMEDLNIRWATAAKILMQFQAVAKLAVVQQLHADVYMVNNLTVKSVFKIQTKKHLINPEINDLAKTFKVKPVKIMMVQKINKIFETNFTYDQNDEADSIALVITHLKRQIKGELK